jgi:3-hydroxyacyl-CoA dehydrogenase
VKEDLKISETFLWNSLFNPARYLKLFEIIPGPATLRKYWTSLQYTERNLGKTAVVAKDTPAFIGNRVGIFGIQSLFHLVKEMGLTIEEVDKLTDRLSDDQSQLLLEQLMSLV